MSETLEVSMRELEKINIIERVINKDITQIIAGKILKLSDRQIRNLVTAYKQNGPNALISKKRGKPSNRSLSLQIKKSCIQIIRQNYEDFGPKLATEYLKNNHQIKISKETLRKWMISSHLWVAKNKENRKHPLRKRKDAFGLMSQVDGSHHDWFEGRSPPCVLMVHIDDATSTLTSLHFAESENLTAYFLALKKHITVYGLPVSIFGDRCSVLTPRLPAMGSITHYHRALKELNIELKLARTPQAKGRVERVNRTLQDRLIKWMRVNHINTIEEANARVHEYIEEHNKFFSKKPSEHYDAHRPLEGISLEEVFALHHERTLSKDFVVQFQNTFYLISEQGGRKTRLFKGAKITIREQMDGRIKAFFKNREVQMFPLDQVDNEIFTRKEIELWKDKKIYHPTRMHLYKRSYKKYKKDNIAI